MKRVIYISLLAVMLLAISFIGVRADGTNKDIINVIMQTSEGDITLELYRKKAPVTVQNFMKYVDGEYYKNAKFYRVVRGDNQAQNNIKIEVIQGGRGMDVTDTPFEPIPHETTRETGILHKDGVISMSRFAPGTAHSEFFICVNDQPHLDYGGKRNPDGQGFAAFGKVIKGMEIIRRIQNAKTIQPKGKKLEFTSGQMVAQPIVIHNVSRSLSD